MHNSDAEFNAIMERAARVLHLKEHRVAGWRPARDLRVFFHVVVIFVFSCRLLCVLLSPRLCFLVLQFELETGANEAPRKYKNDSTIRN